MSESKSPEATVERQYFGTDGIRGTANVHPMTCEVALALGRAVAHQAKHGDHRHRIVIGKDTRVSGYMVEMAFASGVCSMGVDALLLGPLPTPAVAFITRNMRADAGVMISASHNPFEDNGIKIFARDGFKLPDAKELELERFMTCDNVEAIRPTKDEVGKAFRIDDAMGRYIVQLKSVVPSSVDLEGLKVVIDCANGAAYKVAPMVLEELGAHVVAVGNKPDGRNINHNCGALFPQNLAKAVLEHGADLGVALDGDADRLVVVDHQGEVVDGDCLLALTAQSMMQDGTLIGDTMVTTVMSNLALDRAVQGFGGHVIRTQVGDRYVVEAMRQGNFRFGGEQSGHLVYLDHASTGDGMVGALKLMTMMKQSGKALADLKKVFVPFPQSLVSVRVQEKKPIAELDAVSKLIADVEAKLGSDGRVMVRYSGTEPKARVLVEGLDAAQVDAWANEIADTMRTVLN